MKRMQVLGGLAAFAWVFASIAQADEASGLYVGASIGEATNEVDGFEDSGTSFKVMGGYTFNRYFAAELAYIDAGKLQDRIDAIDATVESTGVVAAMLGKLPLSNYVSVFAKLGYAFYEEDLSLQLGDLRDLETNSGDDLFYGAGAEVNLSGHFKLRAEYEVVDVPDADFDIVSVGTTFHF